MAKKTKKTNELMDIETEAEEIKFSTEVDMTDELEVIMSEIGTGASGEYNMKVYRVPEKGGRMAWLFDCDPQFSILDKLRDDYSGGFFELKIFKKNICIKNPRITIEPPINKDHLNSADKNNVNLIELLTKQHESMMLALATMNRPPAFGEMAGQPPVDPIEQMAKLMTLLSTMKDFNRPEPVQNDGEKLSLIDQLKDLNDIKKMFGGGDGETSNSDIIISLLENVGKPISEHLSTISQAAPPKASPPAVKSVQSDESMLKMGISLLLSAAKKNSDPAIYVDLILDKFSTDEIREYLVNKDAMQRIIDLNPQVANFQPWFAELITLISAQCQPDNTPADAPVDEPGDNTVIPITS